MQIKSLMQPTTEVVHLDQSLLDAEDRLRREGLPALAVVDGDEIVGLLTADALELQSAPDNEDSAKIAVRDRMSTKIAFCYPEEDTETARNIMRKAGVNFVLVVDHKRRLCGLATAEDIDTRVKSDTQSEPTHVVKTSGRARGSDLHQPDNYSVKPYVRK